MKRISAVALFCFLFCGCPVRSIHPLFEEKEAAFEPTLIGTWISNGDTYEFSRSGEKEYFVTVVESKGGKQRSITYGARLGRLGNSWVLDSFPGEEPQDYHALPTHVISRIWVGDTLKTASLEGDWVHKMIDTGALKVSYTRRGGDIILTGPTEEIKALVTKYCDDPDAFPNVSKFIRVR